MSRSPSALEPTRTHVLGHVSDSHFSASGFMHDTVRPRVNFEAALSSLESTGVELDALVHTGDVADSGEPEAYREARATTQSVLDRTGWPAFWAAGNHDVRGPFREHLLGLAPSEAPLHLVTEIRGLRLIVLDTSIPGRVEGEVGADQLAWLDEQLREPAEHGTVIALHHAPVPVEVTALQALHLTEQDALARVIGGRDVRAVLGGHLHYGTTSVFAGIPVFVVPATSYVMRVTAPGTGVVGIDGGHAVGLLSLYANGSVGYSLVPVDAAPVVMQAPDSALAGIGVDRPRS